MRAVVENVPEIIALLDGQGRFMYVNRTVAGVTREEVLGRHITEFVPEDRRQELSDLLAAAVEADRMMEAELPGVGPHGSTSVYWCRVLPVHLQAGGPGTGLMCLSLDITERKQAEEHARTLQNELAHVTRLGTMGEMASGMAHELNQPLAAIITYADACRELVESGRMPTAQVLEVLKTISNQAERAGKIIQRLRRLVRKSEPARTQISVNEAVREAAALLEGEIRNIGARIRLDLAAPPPDIAADVVQIEQVLLNLMRNGIEAMSETSAGERELVVSTRQDPAGWVEIAVRDSGRGVSRETANRLFEPFFTTKTEGLGMGLSISRGIVEAHGGRVWLTPNAERGATAHCLLPGFGSGGHYEPGSDSTNRR